MATPSNGSRHNTLYGYPCGRAHCVYGRKNTACGVCKGDRRAYQGAAGEEVLTYPGRLAQRALAFAIFGTSLPPNPATLTSYPTHSIFMNKAELVESVQKALGKDTSKATAERGVEAVIEGIKAGLKKG